MINYSNDQSQMFYKNTGHINKRNNQISAKIYFMCTCHLLFTRQTVFEAQNLGNEGNRKINTMQQKKLNIGCMKMEINIPTNIQKEGNETSEKRLKMQAPHIHLILMLKSSFFSIEQYMVRNRLHTLMDF